MIASSGTARLSYSSTGSGAPVLLIHDGLTDRRAWLHLTERLAPDHRVVVYDQRGHGETTYRPEQWSPVADAIAVLDAAGIESAAVVGASAGARIAIDLCLAHPERVTRLSLIAAAVSGAPVVTDYPEPVRRLAELIDAAAEAGDLDAMNRHLARLWLDGPAAADGRVGGAAREQFLEMNGLALGAADPGARVGGENAWDRLGSLAVPTQVLVGDLDLAEVKDRAEVLGAQVPGARLIRLAEVAHLPYLERDETCLAAVREFLG